MAEKITLSENHLRLEGRKKLVLSKTARSDVEEILVVEKALGKKSLGDTLRQIFWKLRSLESDNKTKLVNLPANILHKSSTGSCSR